MAKQTNRTFLRWTIRLTKSIVLCYCKSDTFKDTNYLKNANFFQDKKFLQFKKLILFKTRKKTSPKHF